MRSRGWHIYCAGREFTSSGQQPSPVPSNSTTTTTISLSAMYKDEIQVQSVDQNGNPISGYYVSFYICHYMGGCTYAPNPVATGFTPATFGYYPCVAENCFGTPVVSVADYGACTFSYWQDNNSTDRMRVQPILNVMTAVYNCGGA
jgi:hypothetical protein